MTATEEYIANYKRVLAENVRKYRKKKRFTQAGLAEAAGLTQGTVSEIENARANPSLDVLSKLAETLDIPHAALLGADRMIGAVAEGLTRSELGQTVSELLSNHPDRAGRWLTDILIEAAPKAVNSRLI